MNNIRRTAQMHIMNFDKWKEIYDSDKRIAKAYGYVNLKDNSLIRSDILVEKFEELEKKYKNEP